MSINYHLMTDDKFIDGFISIAEEVSEKENKYIFTFETPATYVTSGLGISAPLGSTKLDELIRNIRPGDKVFIHWYSDQLMEHLKNLHPRAILYLFFWGGDFLEQPKAFYDFNYESVTRAYLKTRIRKRLIVRSGKMIDKIKNIKRLLHWEISQRRTRNFQVSRRRKFLKRLDYFCHWNEADLDRLKAEYNCDPKFVPFFYDFGFTKVPEATEHSNEIPVIWLGNSATIPNNHLDAVAKLSVYKNAFRIFCPLSYGDRSYGDEVSAVCKQLWGDKFSDLRSYLPIEEYFSIIRDVDVVIMFHNRSQAAGNILAFLKMGKKVYLKKESTIYRLAEKLNMKVFDANTIGEEGFEEIIKPLTETEKQKNREIVNEVFSEEKRYEYVRSLLNC